MTRRKTATGMQCFLSPLCFEFNRLHVLILKNKFALQYFLFSDNDAERDAEAEDDADAANVRFLVDVTSS